MMRPRARGDKRKGGPQIPARNANSGNENERHGRLGRSRGREKKHGFRRRSRESPIE